MVSYLSVYIQQQQASVHMTCFKSQNSHTFSENFVCNNYVLRDYKSLPQLELLLAISIIVGWICIHDYKQKSICYCSVAPELEIRCPLILQYFAFSCPFFLTIATSWCLYQHVLPELYIPEKVSSDGQLFSWGGHHCFPTGVFYSGLRVPPCLLKDNSEKCRNGFKLDTMQTGK